MLFSALASVLSVALAQPQMPSSYMLSLQASGQFEGNGTIWFDSDRQASKWEGNIFSGNLFDDPQWTSHLFLDLSASRQSIVSYNESSCNKYNVINGTNCGCGFVCVSRQWFVPNVFAVLVGSRSSGSCGSGGTLWKNSITFGWAGGWCLLPSGVPLSGFVQSVDGVTNIVVSAWKTVVNSSEFQVPSFCKCTTK